MTQQPLNTIRTDGGTQPRASLNAEKIDEYAQAMLDGDIFPPVIIYHDGANHWLADGFHRHAAASKIKAATIAATIHQGTLRDAILHSAGANATHGLPRSHDDKRRAVTRLLIDPEWSQWSNREIARRCKVSDPFVGKVRSELIGDGSITANISSDERIYTTKHGDQATMNTANIGRKPIPTSLEARLQRAARQVGETPIDIQTLRSHIVTFIPGWQEYRSMNFTEIKNPTHQFGTFWRDLTDHLDESSIPYNEPTLKHVIKQLHAPVSQETAEPEPNPTGPDPNYAPIHQLQNLLHLWLVYATGSRDISTHLEWMAELKAQGKNGEYFNDTADWMETRGTFAKIDLWQACQNHHDDLTQQLTPKTADLPPNDYPPDLLGRLKSSLHTFTNSAERWQKHRSTGLHDRQLREAIAAEYGLGGGTSGPGLTPVEYKGGRRPQFIYNSRRPNALITIEGAQLYDLARSVLQIPYPQSQPPDPAAGPPPFQIGDHVNITDGGWKGQTGRIITLNNTTAVVECPIEVTYKDKKPAEIKPVSAPLNLHWLQHPTSRTAPATPGLHLPTPSFPDTCPIGRADPVNGANCGHCYHYRLTDRGAHQCEEPTWLQTADPQPPTSAPDDDRLTFIRTTRWNIEQLISQADPQTEQPFILSLNRACTNLDAAASALKAN